MSDFLATCNTGDLRTDPKTFREVWCVRCSQPKCSLAQFAQTDPMARRQATWREEFFGKPQADLTIPKFALIAGLNFQDMLETAIKREVSEQRGDWSVPEINITDGRIVRAPASTTRQVEDAVRQLSRSSRPVQEEILVPEENDAVETVDLPVEEPGPPPAFSQPRRAVTESTTPVGDPPAAPPKVAPRPRAGNTPDQGEVMIGGAPRPTSRPAPAPEVDPWAPPPKPKHTVVQPGATITLGGGKK